MYFRNGFLVVRRGNSVPFLFHWSVLLLPLMASGFSYQPGAWVAALLIVFIHELGHAVAVWRARCQVSAIRMDGTGGVCEWSGQATVPQRCAIVWGGILAQLLLFGFAILGSFFVPAAAPPFLHQFLKTMLLWNLLVVVLNLLPIPSLDGFEAWPLLKQVWGNWFARRQRRAKDQRLTKVARQQMQELDRLEETLPPHQAVKDAVDEIFRRAAEEHRAKQRAAEKE